MKLLVMFVAAVALSIAFGGGAAHAGVGPRHWDHWSACHYEDGSGQSHCVWVGSDPRFGNGVGRSYRAIHGGTPQARYHYVAARRALWLLSQ